MPWRGARQQIGRKALPSITASLGISVLVGLATGLLLWPAPASAAKTSVVEGVPASISQVPFVARITIAEGARARLCTGTVVAPRMVLTAAHCLLTESKAALLQPASIEVMTGSGDLADPGLVSAAEGLIVDPEFEPSNPSAAWHDAGLIKLTGPVSAPPVTLAPTPENLSFHIWPPGTLAYAVGWGLTEPGENGPPQELQVAETVTQRGAYCQAQIGAIFHAAGELCTSGVPRQDLPSDYKTTSCAGDDGGPLLFVYHQQLMQIGILQGAPEGCSTTDPQVETRVDAEQSWVEREIAAHSESASPNPSPLSPSPTKSSPAAPTGTGPTTKSRPCPKGKRKVVRNGRTKCVNRHKVGRHQTKTGRRRFLTTV